MYFTPDYYWSTRGGEDYFKKHITYKVLKHLLWMSLLEVNSFVNKHFNFPHVCRGETFRDALLWIGEICSVLPEGVHMMALTAIATQSPVVIAVSPCKRNLMFAVSTFIETIAKGTEYNGMKSVLTCVFILEMDLASTSMIQ